ncbi:hypothetical protein MSM1_20370 [Mycobacterium sp. SM1]|uniref:hypothetical protein n=1 Tax=Mycobacterium sp. SM1 TaxID=2816243 RepID=UPI001BCF37BB|nr:hypothetical protein [Mycobacterium sp. SM1]MBS4730573.1 hypothetical protein [Mycobacterium sp. SM1]
MMHPPGTPGSFGGNFFDASDIARSIIESINSSASASMAKAFKPHEIQAPWLKFPLVDLADLRRQKYPPNWVPKTLRNDLTTAYPIIKGEGIPLVYVPRADVFTPVLAAKDRPERIHILMQRKDDVLDDCAEALAVDIHSNVEDQARLVREAATVYRLGHAAAAQALAVVACDTLIKANIDYRYPNAKRQATPGNLDAAILANILRIELALAPVVKFLTDWSPESGRPQPQELSRHVTVHNATTAHLRDDNGLIAVMLATGLIRALSEMFEWFDARAST